jgi:hypothetical protein
MAQKPHEPTEVTRKTVKAMTGYGIPQDDIALVLGINSRTMRKYYKAEIKVAAPEANAQVVQSLFKTAVGGNVTAQIWWTKTRMGWREKPTDEPTSNAALELRRQLAEAERRTVGISN